MFELLYLKLKPEEVSPLVLAYIGDAVYELLIRHYLIAQGPDKLNKIHKEAVKYVRADTQAKVLHIIQQTLSIEELEIVRRGRNAKPGSTPKSSTAIEYRHSTGFESLIGYLYITGKKERLREIIKIVIQAVQETDNCIRGGSL